MDNRCLSLTELHEAHHGKLAAERRAHLTTCALCAGALEGIALDPDLVEQPLATWRERLTPTSQPLRVAHRARAPRLRALRFVAAASIVGLLVWAASVYEAQPTRYASIQEEFGHVEQPYLRSTRGEAVGGDYYGQATQAYKDSNYALSVELYSNLVDRASTELLATRGRYEYGLALWRNKQYDQAIEELTAARFGESSYYEDATWALAQLYRTVGRFTLARQLYLDLSKNRLGPYAERAAAAVDLLNEDEAATLE